MREVNIRHNFDLHRTNVKYWAILHEVGARAMPAKAIMEECEMVGITSNGDAVSQQVVRMGRSFSEQIKRRNNWIFHARLRKHTKRNCAYYLMPSLRPNSGSSLNGKTDAELEALRQLCIAEGEMDIQEVVEGKQAERARIKQAQPTQPTPQPTATTKPPLTTEELEEQLDAWIDRPAEDRS
jgi:hypothetical protein